MKKTKKKLNKAIVTSLATSVSLLGASAGIVFGISAGMFKTEYMALTDANARLAAARATNYYNQAISSEWDMLADPTACSNYKAWAPTSREILKEDWERLHGGHGVEIPMLNQRSDSVPNVDFGADIPKGQDFPQGSEYEANRKNYVSMVLDGSSHAALDHSFNQSLFQGFLNFIKNKENSPIQRDDDINVYKPGQDTNPFFQDIYRTAARSSRVVGLPGFIHVSPMETLGTYDQTTGLHNFDNLLLDQTAFILIDGDIPNNQNVASVLFRSDEPAFLAGISTCMYFLHNLDVYHENYRDLSVATFGGAAIPTVVIYMGGYQRGVEFFNEFVLKGVIRRLRLALDRQSTWDETNVYFNLFENSKYKAELQAWKNGELDTPEGTKIKSKLIDPIDSSGFLYDEYEVKVIKLGDYSTHFTGTFTAGDAIGITKQLINRGASAILPVAGSQTTDTAQEVSNQKSPCLVIGVDAVMEDGDDQRPLGDERYRDKTVAVDGSTSTQVDNSLKFSACKDMASVVDSISRLAMNNLNWDISGNVWDHTYKSDYSEEATLRLDASNCLYETSGEGTIKLTGLRPGVDLTNKKSLVIPDGIIPKGSTDALRIDKIGADAFKQNIVGIDTIKFETKTSLEIEKNAFNIGQGSALRHIDLTECSETASFTIHSSAFNLTPIVNVQGVFSVDKNLTVEQKTELTHKFIAGISTNTWAIGDHPNPNMAVCNIGFKTCGNIRNGMISVSFDGWYYLIEALRLVDRDPLHGFDNLWHKNADAYVKDNPEVKADTEFMDNVVHFPFTWNEQSEEWRKNNTGLLSFKRYKDAAKQQPTAIYSNYSRIIRILGMVLDEWTLNFPSNLTIKQGTANDPQLAEGTQTMSVAEWLDLNMYFVI